MLVSKKEKVESHAGEGWEALEGVVSQGKDLEFLCSAEHADLQETHLAWPFLCCLSCPGDG